MIAFSDNCRDQELLVVDFLLNVSLKGQFIYHFRTVYLLFYVILLFRVIIFMNEDQRMENESSATWYVMLSMYCNCGTNVVTVLL